MYVSIGILHDPTHGVQNSNVHKSCPKFHKQKDRCLIHALLQMILIEATEQEPESFLEIVQMMSRHDGSKQLVVLLVLLVLLVLFMFHHIIMSYLFLILFHGVSHVT